MVEFLREIRYAFRSLTRSPAFTITAVATLALGIGANTAIFSVVNAAILRPLPFRDSNRIVMLWQAFPERGWYSVPASPSVYLYWKEQTKGVFDHISNIDGGNLTYTGGEFPERLLAAKVPPDFFEVLGVNPVLGRTFAKDEAALGRDDVVLLSYSTWQNVFASDPNVVGRSIILSGTSRTIVGVMPPEFNIAQDAFGPRDVWVPEQIQPDPANHFLDVVAHLAPGVTVKQARAAMDAVSSRLAADYPDNKGLGSSVAPLRDELVELGGGSATE